MIEELDNGNFGGFVNEGRVVLFLYSEAPSPWNSTRGIMQSGYMHRILERISESVEGIKFGGVDIAALERGGYSMDGLDAVTRSIDDLPGMVFPEDGEERGSVKGVLEREALEEEMDRAFGLEGTAHQKTGIRSLIRDAYLKGEIRKRTGRLSGNPRRSDLEKLTAMDLSGSDVCDLAGMEHCRNLRELNLSGCDLGDLSIRLLAKLTGLGKLDLSCNCLLDISPLAGLTELEELHLAGNGISDISPLARLRKLRALDLRSLEEETAMFQYKGNEIHDISPLAGLTCLEVLDISGNQVEDISPLASLKNLKELRMGSNPVEDISPLAGLRKLRELHLWGLCIPDVSPLACLESLEVLDLRYCDMNDLPPVAGLKKLKRVELANTDVGDLTCKDLEVIYAHRGLLKQRPRESIERTEEHLAELEKGGVEISLETGEDGQCTRDLT